jgi:hypothetical protein
LIHGEPPIFSIDIPLNKKEIQAMRNKYSFSLLLLILVSAIACKDTIQRKSASSASISISWEFTNIIKEGETYTDAVMVVKSAVPQKHALGLFYGALLSVLKPEIKMKELQGGTLSGFITDTGGRGMEVLVRHDEYHNKLIIVARQFSPGSPPAVYKTYLIVPVRTRERPDSGF